MAGEIRDEIYRKNGKEGQKTPVYGIRNIERNSKSVKISLTKIENK